MLGIVLGRVPIINSVLHFHVSQVDHRIFLELSSLSFQNRNQIQFCVFSSEKYKIQDLETFSILMGCQGCSCFRFCQNYILFFSICLIRNRYFSDIFLALAHLLDFRKLTYFHNRMKVLFSQRLPF